MANSTVKCISEAFSKTNTQLIFNESMVSAIPLEF